MEKADTEPPKENKQASLGKLFARISKDMDEGKRLVVVMDSKKAGLNVWTCSERAHPSAAPPALAIVGLSVLISAEGCDCRNSRFGATPPRWRGRTCGHWPLRCSSGRLLLRRSVAKAGMQWPRLRPSALVRARTLRLQRTRAAATLVGRRCLCRGFSPYRAAAK